MGVDNGEIVGDVMLGLFVAKKIADRHETQKAARAEGITFEEMRLREQAARYRAKASRPYMMFEERKQKKWTARANACDEQLARFEETRRKAAVNRPNQTNNENQAANYHQNKKLLNSLLKYRLHLDLVRPYLFQQIRKSLLYQKV